MHRSEVLFVTRQFGIGTSRPLLLNPYFVEESRVTIGNMETFQVVLYFSVLSRD